MADPAFYGLLILAGGRTSAPGIPPELHLNLWEKRKQWIFDTAFLDIGLMLDVNDSATTIEFFFPWVITAVEIEDLSPRLQERGAIPAIFNESWICSTSNGSAGYVTTDPAKNESFTFVELGTDIQVKTHNQNTNHAQQAVSLNVPNILAKSKSSNTAATRMYVRFRVKNVPQHFYRVSINPRDRFFLSSWQRTEIIDFRMNVRRGVPQGFAQRVNAVFIDFKKVHLFLMKSRDQDIVFEDKFFRSCRSLEDEHFWAKYSLDASPSDWDKFWSHIRVKDSLGYQWTRTMEQPLTTGNGILVSEFGTLARFKSIRFGLLKFVVVAGLVGALGNMVWDAVKYRYDGSPIATTVQGWLAFKPDAKDSR